MSDPVELSQNEEINKFFSDLASKQEPLGEEFDNVINDHIWELYEE